MPIVKIKHINEYVTFGMWKIEENEDYLQRHVKLSKQERAELRVSQVLCTVSYYFFSSFLAYLYFMYKECFKMA